MFLSFFFLTRKLISLFPKNADLKEAAQVMEAAGEAFKTQKSYSFLPPDPLLTLSEQGHRAGWV